NYRMYLQKMDSSENSSIQSNLAYKKVGSSSLVSNSSNKMTRKSAGNMKVATSAQHLIHGKFAHQVDHSGQSRDKEFSDFMTHHITHMTRIDESRNKNFADLLTGHTKRKTN
ncbi:hypothetical protein HAX54_048039, partial [Datura stramonium]|nr:hypothetical protein [Datura stramonium]